MSDAQDAISSLAAAAQLGRLDFASLLLAIVSLILVLGGLYAFINFRAIAKAQAVKEARAVAQATAERVTNEYLQRELPDLLEAYRSFLDSDDVTDEDADEMASAQDNGEGEKDEPIRPVGHSDGCP